MSTDIRLRYSRATATPRPAGSRQLVGYSPKLERRVALYSRHAFEQWLLLESDRGLRCSGPEEAAKGLS